MLCLALSLWNRCSSRESLKKIVKKKRREKKGSTDNSGNFTLTREEEASISGVSINDKHP